MFSPITCLSTFTSFGSPLSQNNFTVLPIYLYLFFLSTLIMLHLYSSSYLLLTLLALHSLNGTPLQFFLFTFPSSCLPVYRTAVAAAAAAVSTPVAAVAAGRRRVCRPRCWGQQLKPLSVATAKRPPISWTCLHLLPRPPAPALIRVSVSCVR